MVEVSIIIPLYNSEDYLKETMDSVLKQTFADWECLIVDDGSTDNSKTIALDFCRHDSRFKYFSQENSGPSSARNYGIGLAKGNYLLFLDADDILLPGMIKTVLSVSMDADQNLIHYTGAWLGKDSNIYDTKPFLKSMNIGQNISFDDMYEQFGLTFSFIPACVLFPRKSLEGISWNEKLKHSEDWDLYLNISSRNYFFQFIPENLVIYRNSDNSLSKNFSKTFEANYLILEKWLKKNNYLIFSKRCALILKNSIMKYLLKKSDKIIIPCIKIKTIKLFFYYLLIYPYTLYYLIIEFIQVLQKRVLKKKFEV